MYKKFLINSKLFCVILNKKEEVLLNYIDLFSGIGAFHLAMDTFHGNCVFASEINKYALETYYENFKINAYHDIRTIASKDIPDHDLLCAGFPCFTKGTNIITKQGNFPIEQITTGMEVLTHTLNYRKVIHVSQKISEDLYELTVPSLPNTYVTSNHPYFVKTAPHDAPKWLPIREIAKLKRAYVYVISNLYPCKTTWLPIARCEKLNTIQTVYNLEVSIDHTYFANHILVHNCQSFSLAGNGLGFNDMVKGTLFFDVLRILKEKRPHYFILENVKNLFYHNKGQTYNLIYKSLQSLGYHLPKEPVILSPIQLGIPQNRERIFFLGIHDSIYKKQFLSIQLPNKQPTSIYEILDYTVDDSYSLTPHEEKVLEAWNSFQHHFPNHPTNVWLDVFTDDSPLFEMPQWKQYGVYKNHVFYKQHKQINVSQ